MKLPRSTYYRTPRAAVEKEALLERIGTLCILIVRRAMMRHFHCIPAAHRIQLELTTDKLSAA